MQDDYQLTLRRCLRVRAPGACEQQDHHVHRATATSRARLPQVADRADRLAAALAALGVQPGDRVGTFLWNNQTHMEAYLAIPCMGAVLHTLNIRLFPEQLAYVINHAEDKVIIVDASIAPLLARVRDQLTNVQHIIVKGPGDASGARRRPARLRRAARGRAAGGFDYPEVAREHGHGHVLHERHHRQPEGGDVQPSQHVHALADGHLHRQHRAQRARPHAGDRADVPRQRMGHARTRRGWWAPTWCSRSSSCRRRRSRASSTTPGPRSPARCPPCSTTCCTTRPTPT